MYRSPTSRTVAFGWIGGGSTTTETRLLLHTTWDDWIVMQMGGYSAQGAGLTTVDAQLASTPLGDWYGQWHLISCVRSGGNVKLYYDGELKVDDTGLTAVAYLSQVADMRISWTSTTAHIGDIAELIAFREALSDADRISIENYLTQKWFTSCTTSGTWPTTNTGFTASQACTVGVGQETRLCQNDGTWAAVDTSACSCPADGDWPQTLPGVTASITCATGSANDQTRLCRADSTWNTVDASACVCAADGDWPATAHGATASIDCSPTSGLQQTRVCNSDDTWGTADSSACTCDPDKSGSLCQCTYPIENTQTRFPPVLLAADPPTTGVHSEVKDDNLYIRFTEPTKYFNTEFLFPDACTDDGTPTGNPLFSATSVENTDDTNACYRTWTLIGAWAEVYDSTNSNLGCAFVRTGADDDQDPFLTFSLDFRVRNFEPLNNARDTALSRELVWRMPFKIKFPKQADITPIAVQVFSPVLTLAAITNQVVSLDASFNAEATVDLFTQVQYPFRLNAITWNTAEATAQDPIRPAGIDEGSAAPALKDAALCADGGVNSVCENTWEMKVAPTSSQATCEFDGKYRVVLTIDCQPTYTDCPLDSATNLAPIDFVLDSSSHCVSVVEEIGLTTSLVSYIDDTTYVDAKKKDDFLDGQVAYFRAPTSAAEVSITRTEFYTVTLKKGGSLTKQLLVAGVDGPDAAAFSFDDFADNTLVGPGAPSFPKFHFTVLTDAAHLNVGQDLNEAVTVEATVDVYYENAGQTVPTGQGLRGSSSQNVRRVVVQGNIPETSQRIEASASIGAVGSGSSSSSGSGVIAGMSATVVVGAGAGVVLVAVMAVIVIRRRRGSGSGHPSSNSATAVAKSESQQQLTNVGGGEAELVTV